MLNPRLYGALRRRCGDVRISNEGVAFRSVYNPIKRTLEVRDRGELYYTNCPICGDTKMRLSVSHAFLTTVNGIRVTTGVTRCFHEGCRIDRDERLIRCLQDFMDGTVGDTAAATYAVSAAAPRVEVAWRLPQGFRLLRELPADHPALAFIARKYHGFDPGYLSDCYGVGFTDERDDTYRLAHNRVIFPVVHQGVLRGWQGRTIMDDEPVRWYLPPGFNKAVARFNWDRVAPTQIPVLTEGIPTAIAAGPTGIPVFGKSISEADARPPGVQGTGRVRGPHEGAPRQVLEDPGRGDPVPGRRHGGRSPEDPRPQGHPRECPRPRGLRVAWDLQSAVRSPTSVGQPLHPVRTDARRTR
jgi:hypothetical protein